jgi:hypothetical protein
MNGDVLSFTQIEIDNDLLNEIWAFNPRTLDQIDGVKLSIYNIALAQYLIYFTYQRNIAKAELHKLNKYIDRSVSIALSADPVLQKKYGTKTAATDYLITTREDLIEAETKADNLQRELSCIDGIDKTVSELIATLKRELTRRENELHQVRMERRN